MASPHHKLQIYILEKYVQRELVFDQRRRMDVTFTSPSHEVCSLLCYSLNYI